MTDLDNTRTPGVRTAAWWLLALCTAGNLALSARGGTVAVHLAVGLVTLLCLAALAASYLRRGR